MASTDIMLAPGEQGLYSKTMKPNIVLFWLRTTMMVTNKRIAVKEPNTILGIIPLGFEERSMPMGSVAGVTSSFKVRTGRLIVGVLLTLLFLTMLGSSESAGSAFLSFILTVLGVTLVLASLVSTMKVTNNGGGESEVSVSFLDKAAMEDFKNKANEIIYSASSGGQSWHQSYGDGTDNFQNAPQPGPLAQYSSARPDRDANPRSQDGRWS